MTQQQPRHFASAEVTGQVLTVRHDPGRDAVRTVIGIGDNNRMQVTFWKNAAAASIPQGAVIRAWGRLSQWGQPLRTTLDVSPHTQHGFCLVDPAATKPSAGLDHPRDPRGRQGRPGHHHRRHPRQNRRRDLLRRAAHHLHRPGARAPRPRSSGNWPARTSSSEALSPSSSTPTGTAGQSPASSSWPPRPRHRGQPLLSVTRAEPEPEAPPPPRPRRTNGPARDVSIPF
jgi:hypothetical protein